MTAHQVEQFSTIIPTLILILSIHCRPNLVAVRLCCTAGCYSSSASYAVVFHVHTLYTHAVSGGVTRRKERTNPRQELVTYSRDKSSDLQFHVPVNDV